MAINYYEMLGLSAEKFENDQTKIEAVYNATIKKWNSSKSLSEQNKAKLHGSKIKEAFSDPEEWKRQYEEYRKKTNENIQVLLDNVKSNGKVPEKSIDTIADACKVSNDYVITILKLNKLEIDGEDSGKEKKISGVTLESIRPSSYGIITSFHKHIDELGYKDIKELIGDRLGISLSLEGPGADVSKYIEALNELKKKTDKLSRNGKEAGLKGSLEKMQSGAMKFFENNSIDEYKAFLTYRDVNKCLTDTFSNLKKLNVQFINDEPFDRCINQVFGFIGDKEKAKSIVENYFTEKGIGFRRPAPNITVCPYCSIRFEKTQPAHINCPSCGNPFIIKCPKCGEHKNIIEQSVCDGINLQMYPELLYKVKLLDQSYKEFRLEYVEEGIESIEHYWQDFPGVKDLKRKVNDAKSKYSDKIKKINIFREEKRYCGARELCEQIIPIFPDAKDGLFKGIYEKEAEAKSLFEKYQQELNHEKKIETLLDLINEVADYPPANAELKKYPLEKISDVNTSLNVIGNSISVNIGWKSSNKPDSVVYTIIRKIGSAPANENDGEKLVDTKSLSYSDDNIEEGKVYYYAVYAARGPQISNLGISYNPIVYLKPVDFSAIGKNNVIDVRWDISNVGSIKVFYSTSQIDDYGKGTQISNVSTGGCTINNVSNGISYYISVYKTIVVGSKEYHSEIKVLSATPQEPIEPPIISYSFGENSGEYILLWEKDYINISFYCSSQAVGITEKNDTSMLILQSKARQLSKKDIGPRSCIVSLDNQSELYVYPVIVRGTIATIGNIIHLKKVDTIKVTEKVVSAGIAKLKINRWPENTEALYICYSEVNYPEDKNDGDTRPYSIMKGQYMAEPILSFPIGQAAKNYISIFAKVGNDYLPIGKTIIEANLVQQRKMIKYEFSWGFKSGVWITGINDRYIPNINIIGKRGSIPPRDINDGEAIYRISSGMIGPNPIFFNVKLKRGVSYKLFTDNTDYLLIVSGPTHRD